MLKDNEKLFVFDGDYETEGHYNISVFVGPSDADIKALWQECVDEHISKYSFESCVTECDFNTWLLGHGFRVFLVDRLCMFSVLVNAQTVKFAEEYL